MCNERSMNHATVRVLKVVFLKCIYPIGRNIISAEEGRYLQAVRSYPRRERGLGSANGNNTSPFAMVSWTSLVLGLWFAEIGRRSEKDLPTCVDCELNRELQVVLD